MKWYCKVCHGAPCVMEINSTDVPKVCPLDGDDADWFNEFEQEYKEKAEKEK